MLQRQATTTWETYVQLNSSGARDKFVSGCSYLYADLTDEKCHEAVLRSLHFG
jgi:hypothetical protein